MRIDLTTALNGASLHEKPRLTSECREHLFFLDRSLPPGETILRLLRGRKNGFPLLAVLTDRRFLVVDRDLDVASYVLVAVTLFAVTPYPRSLVDKLLGRYHDHSMLYVKDDVGYSWFDVPAEDGERFEIDFQRARSRANMRAG